MEDHRYETAAQLAQTALVERQHVLAVDADRPLDTRPPCRQQTHHGAQGDALARAGLTQDAQHLAGTHAEADAIHRVHRRLAGDEADREVADLDERGHCIALEWPEFWFQHMAGGDMRVPFMPRTQFRRASHTDRLGERAARVKAATAGRIDRAGWITGDRRFLDTARGIHRRARTEQRPRVGMQRPGEDVLGRPQFDHPAKIHHQHPVADIAHRVQVVTDEQIGQVELLLQRAQQVEHLRLHRLVERGHRLIEDHHARLYRQRAGNVHPLLLTTGEFVRIALTEQVGVEADLHQHVARDAARIGPLAAMNERTERHRISHRHPRVQRRVAVLEHHLHVAAQSGDGDAARRANRFAVEDQLTGVALHQMQQDAGERGFAAA